MKDKNSIIRKQGLVVKNLGRGLYKVRFENNYEILTRVSGKIMKYSIQILENDLVEVEISIYDKTKGRIIRRLRNESKNISR